MVFIDRTGITVLFLCWLFGTSFVLPQEDITPTAAPSKTPTPEREVEAVSPALVEPFTQADLAILTGNVQRPNGIVWHNDHLYAVCTGDSTVYELDDTTAETRTYIFGVRNAHTLYAENSEGGELVLWVPDFQANTLLRIDRNGVRTARADLDGPWGIAYATEDTFLISNLQANNLAIVNRSGELRAAVTGLRAPTGIAVDDAHIYIANTGSARRAIEWVDKDAVLEESDSTPEPQPLVSGLQNTTGLALAEDGYLYFAYALGTRGVIGRVDPEVCRTNGGCENSEVEIVVFTELSAPLAGLTISPDMRLFVHTIFSPDIYWVQLPETG
jgi:sugar lactone lactonase YvrE